MGEVGRREVMGEEGRREVRGEVGRVYYHCITYLCVYLNS